MKKELEKHIVLIGMMGTGKTHLGQRLAKKIGVDFIDSDSEIISSAGCSVADIFKNYGEEEFRRLEESVIDKLLCRKGKVVLALGGGAVLNANTAQRVFGETVSVWLRAPLEQILERVSRNTDRPLLACANPLETLKKLMEDRQPYYEKASLYVDHTDGNSDQVIRQILDSL